MFPSSSVRPIKSYILFITFSHSIFTSFPQNILNLLQFDLVRENRENDFQAKIAEKEKDLQETKSAAEALTKTQTDQLELLAKRANDLEKAKEGEKTRADEAE